MRMSILKIVGWKKPVEYSGWGEHINVELRRRLRSSLDVSPRVAKTYAKKAIAKEYFTIHGIKENELESIAQILDLIGAEIIFEQDD